MGASSSRIVTQPQQEPAQAPNSKQISKLIGDFDYSFLLQPVRNLNVAKTDEGLRFRNYKETVDTVGATGEGDT